MRRITFLVLIIAALTVARVSARPPQVVVASPFIESAEVQPVDTLDGTRVYRLVIELPSLKTPSGVAVEYEIRAASGAVAGGGMFTVHPEESGSVKVLTGFGGLELGPEHRVTVDLVPDVGTATRKGALTAQQITDTCSSFCDRCSDKAGTLCTQGVSTYNCSCSGENRSCTFTCSRPAN